MARKTDIEPRGTSEIFSLSFLDVFACALGALVLILLMVFNQVAAAFDPEVVQEQIEEMRDKRDAVVKKVSQGREDAELARKYDAEGNAVQQRVAEMEAQLKAAAEAEKKGTPISNAQLEQMRLQAEALRNSVNGVKARVVKRRRPNDAGQLPLAGGSATVSQEPRLLDVTDGKIRDIATGEIVEAGSGGWDRLRSSFAAARAREYPLFIVRPSGVETFLAIERELDDSGLPYGYEPYTKIWDAMLSQGAGQ